MMFQRLLCLFLACAAVSHAFSASSVKQQRHQRERVAIVWRADDTAQEGTEAVEDATVTSSSEPKMPPVIQQIADEQRQYQVNLGKAMDVLRRDMQDILTKKPGKFTKANLSRFPSSPVESFFKKI